MAAPVPVQGLFETHLTVRDVRQSVRFYRDVVGLSVALDLPERNAAFMWIGEPGRSMLEYLTMLGDDPRPDAGIVPWSESAQT